MSQNRERIKVLAMNLRGLSDNDLVNLFLEAVAWRKLKLQQLVDFELKASESPENKA